MLCTSIRRMATRVFASWWAIRLWMNGRPTTRSRRQKLEAILRRDGASAEWRYGPETSSASWGSRTGKNMLRWTTSRFMFHRNEVIPYERVSEILLKDRTLKGRSILEEVPDSANFSVLRQAVKPAACGRGFRAIAVVPKKFTQSLRRVVVPPHGSERLGNKQLDLRSLSARFSQRQLRRFQRLLILFAMVIRSAQGPMRLPPARFHLQ